MDCTHLGFFCRIQYLLIDKLDLKLVQFPVSNLSNSTTLTLKCSIEYFRGRNFSLTAASNSACVYQLVQHSSASKKYIMHFFLSRCRFFSRLSVYNIHEIIYMVSVLTIIHNQEDHFLAQCTLWGGGNNNYLVPEHWEEKSHFLFCYCLAVLH